MGSDHCAGLVRFSVQRLAGIDGITTIATHKLAVEFNPRVVAPEQIRQAVIKADYKVAAIAVEGAKSGDTSNPDSSSHSYLTQACNRFYFAAVPTTIVMVLMLEDML